MTDRNSIHAKMQSAGQRLANHTRMASAARTELARQLRGRDKDFANEEMAAFNQTASDTRNRFLAEGLSEIEGYRSTAVLKGTPSHWPQTAAQAHRVAAMLSVAPHWSPAVWRQELERLTAANDVGALQALLPLASSLVEYRTPFRGHLTGALIDAQAALDNVPEVVESARTATYCDEIAGELRHLAAVSAKGDGAANVEIFAGTNSWPLLGIMPQEAPPAPTGAA